MSHPVFRDAVAPTVMGGDGLLPLAETVQRLVSVMVDLQIRLQKNKVMIIALFFTKVSLFISFSPLPPKTRKFVCKSCLQDRRSDK